MINSIRTNSEHPDFVALVRLLDAELARRNGAQHAYYDQFNKIDAIKHVIVVYEGDEALGCGAIKAFAPVAMEVKRMYTTANSRGKGIATKVLQELEKWATELGYQKCVLETGRNLPEAVHLYQKNGYQVIPNYGQYIGVDNSVCFEKQLAR
jgi:putative acetyltransferase